MKACESVGALKRLCAFGLILAALGCASKQKDAPPESRVALNTAMVKLYTAEAVDRAIVRQHTLYPYHFRPASVELNELGRRDVTVLARFYKDNGGQVNVRQGDVDPRLYAGRINAVREALAMHGVDRGQIRMADGLPGGDGLASDQVAAILEAGMGSSSDDESEDRGSMFGD